MQNYLKKLAKRHGVEESGSSGKSRTRKWEAQHQAFRTKKGLNRRTTLARVEASGGCQGEGESGVAGLEGADGSVAVARSLGA